MAAQVWCAKCGRMVSARGNLHPYAHTTGSWSRDGEGKLTIRPPRCDGHTLPGRVPGFGKAKRRARGEASR